MLPVVLLAFLTGWLVALRTGRRVGWRSEGARWGVVQGSPAAWALASALAIAASAPLLRHLPFFLAQNAILYADAASHAVIGQAVARHGAPHGWIDVYNGGFPLGVNYPPLGWLATAGLVRLGVPTRSAVQALGLLPYVLTPLLIVLAGRRLGARPLAALAAALLFAWISPYNRWLGTFESYIGLGLLSQSLALPLVVLVAHAIALEGPAWRGPVFAALLAAAHPQITAAATLAALPAFLMGDVGVRSRVARAVGGALVAGVALYGPGLAALGVPFGWIPQGTPAWIAGYRPERLVGWLGGELFDRDRAPVVTICWLLSTLFLFALSRQRVPRVVLATSLWTLALSMLGRTLPLLGEPGERLMGFLQPQRAFALVPVAMAAVVLVAAEEAMARGASALRALPKVGALSPHVVPALVLVLLGAAGAFALPSQAAVLEGAVAIERDWLAGGRTCGRLRHAGAWVAPLDRGRLSAIEEAPLFECAKWMGLELESPVPLGVSTGAGGHVGVHALAFQQVRPELPGSAARAEALGVRALLHHEGARPGPADAWRVVASSGGLELSERLGGTDLVGVGCVRRLLRGDYAAVRRALLEDLAGEATVLRDPHQLTAIEEGAGEVELADVSPEGCDPTGAAVRFRAREPGAYEATVEAPSGPVDVVIRATAFPTWAVRVDGRPTTWRRVAPGFVSVRIPAGRHEVEAVVSPPPLYGAGLLVAAGAVAALGGGARPLGRVLGRLRRARRRPEEAQP